MRIVKPDEDDLGFYQIAERTEVLLQCENVPVGIDPKDHETGLVIIDETEQRIAKQYRNTPFVGKYFKEEDIDQARMVAPVNMVPARMEKIQIKLIDNGKVYHLSFRKPERTQT